MSARNRKLTRLKGYDYSRAGFYFVTVCTKNRVEWFGNIADGKMILNDHGNIVVQCWHDLVNHYKNVRLDEFMVMPDHVHGIIIIQNNVGNGLKPFPTDGVKSHELPEIVRGFKTFSSRRINEQSFPKFQWQKSFYDRIIRNERDLNRIRKYIQDNPGRIGFHS
jgi:REP element-mobilizing transposase RayT